MELIRVNPTRMELKKLRTRLITARRGHKLLKDKRDELMRRFLDTVRETKAQREKAEALIADSHRSFSAAAAVMSDKVLTEALMLPRSELSLDVSYKNIMSVNVPVFEYRAVGNSGTGFGLAFTSGELDASIELLSGSTGELIRLAQLEKTSQMLANEIEKTRRRVNALEHVMIPQLEATIKSITMKLDENERGNLTRLMKVKDMMLEAARSGAESAR